MPNSTVFYLLGWALFCLTVLMLVTAVAAFGLGEGTETDLVVISLCITGFVAGALVIGFHGRQERIRRQDTLWLLVFCWTVVSVFGALPFLGHPEFADFSTAIFESVSGLTTTGASVARLEETMPASLLLWRGLLQWFGGAMSLLTAVLVLAPFGVLSTPINITIPGYEKDDLTHSLVASARQILPAYAVLTLMCAVCLWIAQVPAFEALCLALSTVSTGGFTPTAEGVHGYNSVWVESLLVLFMIAGATSFLSHRAVLRRVAGTHSDNKESAYLIFLILVGTSLLMVASWSAAGDEPTGGLEAFRIALFRTVSLITTTGYDNATSQAAGVPFVLAFVACVIGGAAFSTAGGLKVFRAFSMLNQAHRELKRLIHPRSVTRAHSTGKPIDVQIMKTIWSTFLLFGLSVSVISVVLAVEGASFDAAMTAAVAAMSNIGPAMEMTAFDVTDAPNLTYADMSEFSRWILMGGMILGRIEFVIVLSLAFMPLLRR